MIEGFTPEREFKFRYTRSELGVRGLCRLLLADRGT